MQENTKRRKTREKEQKPGNAFPGFVPTVAEKVWTVFCRSERYNKRTRYPVTTVLELVDQPQKKNGDEP